MKRGRLRVCVIVALPSLLLFALVRAKQAQDARYNEAEKAELQNVVRRGTSTSDTPQGFSLTTLPIKFEQLQSTVGYTPLPPSLYEPNKPPGEAIYLPIRITNLSNRKLVLTGTESFPASTGFYMENPIFAGSPLCAVCDSDVRREVYSRSPNDKIVFGTSHILLLYIISPQSQIKNFKILPAKKSAILNVRLDYDSGGSVVINAFVKNSGRYRLRMAMVFKVDGKGQYAMSEPLVFNVVS